MSLSALLLPKKKKIDPELDALFTAKPGPSAPKPQIRSKASAPAPSTSSIASKKRRLEDTDHKQRPRGPHKRSKAKYDAKGKQKTEKASAQPLPEDSDSDEASDLEKDYLHGKIAAKPAEENEEDEEDPASSGLVHESLKEKKTKGAPKAKFIPSDETPEQRDARTIFIGNLPVAVAERKTCLKILRQHITSHVPTARIESIRLRSVPFQAPTSELPDAKDDGSGKPKPNKSKASTHELDRAATWREKQDEDKDKKKFLNPKEKKKIAFINQEFHPTADTMNAYLVFAHPDPTPRAANLPPLVVMDPYEAARMAVEKCDGTTFMERMIRVDIVAKDARVEEHVSDPKLSVFVGNLDFATKEEDLRVFFEGVVSAERGPVPEEGKHWVMRVRIVRDRETQLGKGFGYVQFFDRECVDEVLALEEEKLKFAKRKLRVQRCKTIPGVKVPTATASASPIPKSDPSLGEKLVHLSKDDRKKVKAENADRVARRLAKKKARNKMPEVSAKTRERVRNHHPKKGDVAPKKKEKRVRSEKSLSKRNMKK